MAKRFERAREYTQKYKHLLHPCKWCDSYDIEIQSDRSIFSYQNIWNVVCTNCGNCVCGEPKVKDAVKRWNDANPSTKIF